MYIKKYWRLIFWVRECSFSISEIVALHTRALIRLIKQNNTTFWRMDHEVSAGRCVVGLNVGAFNSLHALNRDCIVHRNFQWVCRVAHHTIRSIKQLCEMQNKDFMEENIQKNCTDGPGDKPSCMKLNVTDSKWTFLNASVHSRIILTDPSKRRPLFALA